MRGDPYGARKQVRTMEEAKQTLEQYLEGTGKKAAIGNIEERRWFFIIELLDADGTPSRQDNNRQKNRQDSLHILSLFV